jgi:hypothetical protein
MENIQISCQSPKMISTLNIEVESHPVIISSGFPMTQILYLYLISGIAKPIYPIQDVS